MDLQRQIIEFFIFIIYFLLLKVLAVNNGKLFVVNVFLASVIFWSIIVKIYNFFQQKKRNTLQK